MPTSTEPGNIDDLRARIAARIESRELPRAGQHKMFAGFGQNEICAACGQPVHRSEVLYEVELTGESAALAVLAMHRWCFDLWMEVSRERQFRPGKSGIG